MHKSNFKFNYQIKIKVKSPTEDQDCETCTVQSSVLNTSLVTKDDYGQWKLKYFEDVRHSATLSTINLTHTWPKWQISIQLPNKAAVIVISQIIQQYFNLGRMWKQFWHILLYLCRKTENKHTKIDGNHAKLVAANQFVEMVFTFLLNGSGTNSKDRGSGCLWYTNALTSLAYNSSSVCPHETTLLPPNYFCGILNWEFLWKLFNMIYFWLKWDKYKLQFTPRVHKFSKNIATTPKF